MVLVIYVECISRSVHVVNMEHVIQVVLNMDTFCTCLVVWIVCSVSVVHVRVFDAIKRQAWHGMYTQHGLYSYIVFIAYTVSGVCMVCNMYDTRGVHGLHPVHAWHVLYTCCICILYMTHI